MRFISATLYKKPARIFKNTNITKKGAFRVPVFYLRVARASQLKKEISVNVGTTFIWPECNKAD